jgi:hypothetical protein
MPGIPSVFAHVRKPESQVIVPTLAIEVDPKEALDCVEPVPETLPAPSVMLLRARMMLIAPGRAIW